MSKRNVFWLVAIIVIGVVVWLSSGIVWGLISAVIVLVASEAIERVARQRRRRAKLAAAGTDDAA